MLQKLDFSIVTTEDLMKAGITTKFLYIAPAKATTKLSSNAAGVIEDLQAQINKIYERVNMDVCTLTYVKQISVVNNWL
jgi:4-hydroxy-3-methylbut-2-enyl diphosphate reductase IspH